MLKKVMLFAALAVSSINFGQMDHPSEFIMVKTDNCHILGCEAALQSNYVVLESKGTAKENYQKAISWVNTTFKNPDEVLKAQIENKYIRVNGIGTSLTAINSMGMIYTRNIQYTITIYVKDDKIKFELGSLQEYVDGSTAATSGWYTFTGIPAYRKNGKVKKTIIPYVNKFENYFNNLAIAVANQDIMLEAETSDW
jgi:hypothetical protein